MPCRIDREGGQKCGIPKFPTVLTDRRDKGPLNGNCSDSLFGLPTVQMGETVAGVTARRTYTMTRRTGLLLIAIIALTWLWSGCRSIQSVTGNQYADPQVELKWIARPEMDMPEADEPTVYFRSFKDAVGSGLDLTPQIKEAITSNGYKLTRSKNADYLLVATLRHFAKSDTFDGGASAIKTVSKLAPLAGAAAGVYAGRHSTGKAIAGGVGGGLAGALIGATIENRSQVYEWDMILDIELHEKVEGGFVETRRRQEGASSKADVRKGTESGGRDTSDSRTGGFEKEQSHFRNTFRLVAMAYQTQMTEQEALDIILPKLPGSVGSVLP